MKDREQIIEKISWILSQNLDGEERNYFLDILQNEKSSKEILSQNVQFASKLKGFKKTKEKSNLEHEYVETIERIKDLKNSNSPSSVKRYFKAPIKTAHFKVFVSTAAAILLFITFWFFLQRKHSLYERNFLSEKASTTVEAPIGRQARCYLPDGTKIWLNAGSSLSYSGTFPEKRLVRLNGEAYFDVSHIEDRPFTVQTKELNIRVLGTKFNVSAYDNDNMVETTLISGKVILEDKTKKRDILELIPDQKAVLLKNSQKIEIKSVDAQKTASWISDKYVFSNETLYNLTKRLERSHKVVFIFNDESVKRYRLSGSYNLDEDIKEIMKILKLTAKIEYEIKGNKIIIKTTN